MLVGQGPFGAEVLQQLIQKGEEVVGVFSTTGRQGDRVQEMADKFGVPLWRVSSMKGPDVHLNYSRLAPDLGVMAFVTDIVPGRILTYPRLGTIQYHPSLLPKHRGGSAINWAIIKGETRTGMTVFWPDEGIDTGPILLQKSVDISPDDTVGTLYFNKLYPIGIESLLEAVDLVRRGIAPRIPQDESQATYEKLCDESDTAIDWSQSTRDIYNLIRGCNPQPGACTRMCVKPVKIFDSEPCAGTTKMGKPGQVLGVSGSGINIATGDGAILVKRVQPESMPKTEAAKYAESAGLKPGVVLGT
ncbi:MAG: methionyl-tRNA formyltransferase [Chloroflexi bacterium]|nr:methionyl-tRNA formyltransferase [Chloroflexota bacterium]